MDSSFLHGPEFAADPIPAWRLLRDEHPVHYDEIDDMYVLTRHEDVRWAYTEASGLSNRLYEKTLGKVFGPTLLQMDGHEHIQRRKIVAPQVVGSRLAAYGELVDKVAAEMVAETVRGEFDLVDRIAHRLPGTVIASMLGLPSEDLPEFFIWYNTMMAGLWRGHELRRRGHAAHLEFQDYLAPKIAERRENPGSDLISRLIFAEVDGERIEGDDLGAFISLLLTAGGETTDKAISNLWWLLLTHPDEYKAVRADPDRLDLVFSEMMRLYPPLVYGGREATEPVERHGVTIPVGAAVRLAMGSANRDERVFVEPDRFWPDRPDLHLGKEIRNAPTAEGRASHLSFAAGAHFCLGYELARLETVTVSRYLLEALGDSPEIVSVDAPVVDAASRAVERLVLRAS